MSFPPGVPGREPDRRSRANAIAAVVRHRARGLPATAATHSAAHLHDFPLEIVHALDFSALLAGGVAPPPEEMKDVLRAHGHRYLRAAREIAEAQGAPAVATRLDPDRAAQALIEASRKASLVVLGDRGRGGFPGLLLGSTGGSTGQALLHNAACPVYLVRTAC